MSDAMFTEPLVQSIGWALVHFMWQGALIAAVAAAVLACLRHARATTRYGVACGALTLMLAAPVATTLRLLPAEESVSSLGGSLAVMQVDPAPLATGESASPGAPPIAPSRPAFDRVLSTAVMVWMAGVLFLSIRLATGWYALDRLRRHHTCPLPDSLQTRVTNLAARLRVARRVRVVESSLVAVPSLVGWIRPVILLPVGIVTAMPAAHLDAVIAHELAHVGRHDYLVNALQAVVETLLFYHPGVWWCSRQVRIEREHCCDDLAAAACGNPLEYATALASLEELRRGGARLVLAATDGPLLERVRRLVVAPPPDDGRARGWLAAVAVAVVVMLAAAGSTLTGADLRQADAVHAAPVDTFVDLGPSAGGLRRALVDLTAFIARLRGFLFSPQVLPVPPMPPVTAFPPLPPERPTAPEPPQSPRPPETPFGPEPPTPPEPPAVLGPELPPLMPEPPTVFGPEPPPLTPEPPGAFGPEPPRPPESPLSPAPLQRAPAPPAPPSAPASPRAPTPPATPALPAAPAAPAPPAGREQGRGRMTWDDRGERMTLEYRGSITLADDDRDIARMSADAYFFLSEDRSRIPLIGTLLGAAREIELRGRTDGTIERRYFVGRREVPYEPAGRQWLSDFLPVLVRRTGFAAEQRVARIVRRDGVAGLSRELGLLEGDFVRSLYVRLLTRLATLSTADLNSVLQALQIGSDFEMAQALIAIAGTQTIAPPSGPAFFRAARTIESDFELRRALSPLLRRPQDAAFARDMFATSAGIDSDFEQAEFLKSAAASGAMQQAPDAFFDALATVDSDFEHRRVLADVLRRRPDAATVRRMFQDAGRIDADFEQAEFLRAAASAGFVEQGRDVFFGAVATLGSAFERRRVLSAVVARPGVPAETLESVVRLASDMGSEFEQAELLLAIARNQRVEGRLRQAILDVADSMQSDHERGRVFTAVIRAERASR